MAEAEFNAEYLTSDEAPEDQEAFREAFKNYMQQILDEMGGPLLPDDCYLPYS